MEINNVSPKGPVITTGHGNWKVTPASLALSKTPKVAMVTLPRIFLETFGEKRQHLPTDTRLMKWVVMRRKTTHPGSKLSEEFCYRSLTSACSRRICRLVDLRRCRVGRRRKGSGIDRGRRMSTPRGDMGREVTMNRSTHSGFCMSGCARLISCVRQTRLWLRLHRP